MTIRKTCARCKVSKKAVFFTKSKQNRDGLHSYCKECKYAEMRAWKLANPIEWAARQAEADRRFRERHPKKVREYKTAWARNNPDKISAKNLKYAQRNREKLAQYAREYRARIAQA